jgi:predicted ferric reductase
MLLFKLIIVILLIFILVSLFTALYFLVRNPDSASAVMKSLAVRIGLSLFLLALIFVGAQTGLLEPHGFGE